MIGLKENSVLSEDFLKEEVRYDYLVSSDIKKVWKTELDILREFDRICREYDLQYLIDQGTLLGAVRHQGFIPWDDDLDVIMMRDDYEKLKIIGPEAFCGDFFFQNTYTDEMMFGFSKIRKTNTSAIEHMHCSENFNQGIFIDIFPLDTVPERGTTNPVFEMEKELLIILYNPEIMIKRLEDNLKTTLSKDMIQYLLKAGSREVYSCLEEFCLEHFGKTDFIELITELIHTAGSTIKKREWYKDITMLPFENLLLPAPIGYKEILSTEYGDYMQIPEDKGRHNIVFDAETPYKETFIKLKKKVSNNS